MCIIYFELLHWHQFLSHHPTLTGTLLSLTSPCLAAMSVFTRIYLLFVGNMYHSSAEEVGGHFVAISSLLLP